MNRSLLLLLVVQAFLLSPAFFVPHIENDEVIYKALAAQTTFVLQGYTLRGTSIFASLPAIYDTPLFFHPPVYILLGKALAALVGENGFVVVSVAAALGTTLATFLLGKLMYGERAGLVAAALWVLNPLQLFVAQRIWLDALLVFFCCWSVYLYAAGIHRGLRYTFLAGVMLALGVLTKYTAILTVVPIVVLAVVYHRDLVTAKLARLVICAMPAVLVLGWVYFFYTRTGALVVVPAPTAAMLEQFPCSKMVFARPWYFFGVQTLLVCPVYLLAFLAVGKKIARATVVLAAWSGSYVAALTVYGVLGGGFALRYILPAYPALSLLAGSYVSTHLKSTYLLTVVGCFIAIGCGTALINYGHVGAVDISNLFEGCYSGCSCR
jgi:4-amino-4-deoxy-L-arabinose transferase-like glycosyltransferase